MKLRKIRVIVKPWKDVWAEEKGIARRLERGERDPLWAQETLYFTSLEELQQVLTINASICSALSTRRDPAR